MINMPTKKPLSQVVLLCCGFAGVLFIVIYTVFGLFTPGFNAFRDTISRLELVKNGWVQQGNFILHGVLTILFTIGLSKELIKSTNAKFIVLFQLLIGIGLIGDGLFIYEPLHTSCDIIVFNSAMIVLFLFAWQFYKTKSWKGWIVYSLVAAFLMMAFLAAFGVANAYHGWSGLFERLAVLPRTLWSIVLIIKLLKGRRLICGA